MELSLLLLEKPPKRLEDGIENKFVDFDDFLLLEVDVFELELDVAPCCC